MDPITFNIIMQAAATAIDIGQKLAKGEITNDEALAMLKASSVKVNKSIDDFNSAGQAPAAAPGAAPKA